MRQHNLIPNYFTLGRLKAQFRNRHLSWMMIYDSDTRISNKSRIQRFVIMRDSKIGDYSYIGYSSNLYRATIGKFCSISKHVSIGLTHHPTDFLSTSPVFFTEHNATGIRWIEKDAYDDRPESVTIGNDVWIAMNVTIMGGVTIGNGAIIGAHSVVTKDVPPYAIVGGIPAKVIRYRFSASVIAKLQALKWWDLPEEFLKKHVSLFQKPVTDENIAAILQVVNSGALA